MSEKNENTSSDSQSSRSKIPLILGGCSVAIVGITSLVLHFLLGICIVFDWWYLAIASACAVVPFLAYFVISNSKLSILISGVATVCCVLASIAMYVYGNGEKKIYLKEDALDSTKLTAIIKDLQKYNNSLIIAGAEPIQLPEEFNPRNLLGSDNAVKDAQVKLYNKIRSVLGTKDAAVTKPDEIIEKINEHLDSEDDLKKLLGKINLGSIMKNGIIAIPIKLLETDDLVKTNFTIATTTESETPDDKNES